MENFMMAVMTFIFLFFGRFVNIKITKPQQSIVQSQFFLHIFTFSMAYMSCKNFKWALVLYVAFMFTYKVLTNHESNLSILPQNFISTIDVNNDGTIDDNELTNAIEILNEIYHKRQQTFKGTKHLINVE